MRRSSAVQSTWPVTIGTTVASQAAAPVPVPVTQPGWDARAHRRPGCRATGRASCVAAPGLAGPRGRAASRRRSAAGTPPRARRGGAARRSGCLRARHASLATQGPRTVRRNTPVSGPRSAARRRPASCPATPPGRRTRHRRRRGGSVRTFPGPGRPARPGPRPPARRQPGSRPRRPACRPGGDRSTRRSAWPTTPTGPRRPRHPRSPGVRSAGGPSRPRQRRRD